MGAPAPPVAIGWLDDAALDPARFDDVLASLPLHRLHQGDGRYLVAWRDGRAVGHVHLTAGAPPQGQDLYVVAEARGEGVGAALLAAAESACRERGDDRLVVEVSVRNERAEALYRRLGYQRTGAPVRRVQGRIEVRGGPLDVDDELVALEKRL